MAENKYNQPEFFSAYAKLPRSLHGLDGAPEWPTLRRMVGDVKDASVLDLGCGYGWFCRWAQETGGAKSVHGIDVSEKMLDRARAFPTHSAITYERRDLQGIDLPTARFDLVYSSLTLHYLPDADLRNLFVQVSRSLKRPGGRFVFSVEHPVMTAPSDPKWKRDTDGKVFWPLNRYIDEGLRMTNWLNAGEVRKHHHMVETYLSLLIENGFVLTDFRESWEGMERRSVLDEEETGHRPYFLLVGARI